MNHKNTKRKITENKIHNQGKETFLQKSKHPKENSTNLW